MPKKIVEILVVLMFLFLIGLVFLCTAYADERKDMKIYIRYYNIGQNVAENDAKHNKLWVHYQHKMKETLKEKAYREGYLDNGAYYAMPVINKIKYSLTNHDWIDAKNPNLQQGDVR